MRIQEEQNDVLTVKPFDNQLRGSKTLHPDLPQPPCVVCMVGPAGSGKSNLILRMIYGNKKTPKCDPDNKHYKFYRHFFDKIYIFSPTWQLDPKTTRCRIPDDQIFEDPKDYIEIIEEIVASQEDDIEEDGKADAHDRAVNHPRRRAVEHGMYGSTHHRTVPHVYTWCDNHIRRGSR